MRKLFSITFFVFLLLSLTNCALSRNVYFFDEPPTYNVASLNNGKIAFIDRTAEINTSVISDTYDITAGMDITAVVDKSAISEAYAFLNSEYNAVKERCDYVVNHAEHEVTKHAFYQSGFTIAAVISGAIGAVVIAASPANAVVAASSSALAGIFAGLREFISDNGAVGQEKATLIKKRDKLIEEIAKVEENWRLKDDTTTTHKAILTRRAGVIHKLATLCSYELSPYDISANMQNSHTAQSSH